MNRKQILRQFRADFKKSTGMYGQTELELFRDMWLNSSFKRHSTTYTIKLGYDHGNTAYCLPDDLMDTLPMPPAREGYYFDQYMRHYELAIEGLPF